MKTSQYIVAFGAILFMLFTFFEPWVFFKKRKFLKKHSEVINSLSKVLKRWKGNNFLLPLGYIFKNLQLCYPNSVIALLSYQNHREYKGTEWSRTYFSDEISSSVKEHISSLKKALKSRNKEQIFFELIVLSYINHYSEAYYINANDKKEDLKLTKKELANDLQDLVFEKYSHTKICQFRDKWLKKAHATQDVSIFIIAKYLSIFKIRFPSPSISSGDMGELEYHLWGLFKGIKDNDIKKQYFELETLIMLGRKFRIIA